MNLMDINKDIKKLAVEKIDNELKTFKGDKYGQAVHTYVANALRDFCEKNERFAEVLYETKRSLSDCIAEIMKGCGNHISDIEVYRRAAKLYFPDSEVEFVMTITLPLYNPDEEYISQEPTVKAKDADAKPNTASKPKEKPKAKEESEVIQLSLF